MKKSRKKVKKQKKSSGSFLKTLGIFIALISFVVPNYDNVKNLISDLFYHEPTIESTRVNEFDINGETLWRREDDDLSPSDDNLGLGAELDKSSQSIPTPTYPNAVISDSDVDLVYTDFSYYDSANYEFTDEYISDSPSSYYYIGDIGKRTIACSLRTTVANYNSKPIRLDSLETEVVECEPLYNNDTRIDIELNGRKLKFYVFNNGWTDSLISVHKFYLGFWRYLDNGTYPRQEEYIECSLLDVSLEIFSLNNVKLSAGDVFQFAEFELDAEKYYELVKKAGLLPEVVSWGGTSRYYFETIVGCEFDCTDLRTHISDIQQNTTSRLSLLTFDEMIGDFYLSDGSNEIGAGEADETSAMFLVTLDVDSASKSKYIKPYGIGAYPQIEDTYGIETVIVPNKSCRLKLRNRFYFGDVMKQTEVFEVIITVPVFYTDTLESNDFDVKAWNPLLKELAKIDIPSDEDVRFYKEKYRYTPSKFKIRTKDY